MAELTSTCRVSIRSPQAEADMELPADVPVGELVPGIIDLLGVESDARGLRLARRDGTLLAERSALVECGVHDGCVLFLLGPDLPAPPAVLDACSAVLQVSEDRGRREPESLSTVLVVLWSVVTVSVVACLDARAGRFRTGLLCAAALLALVAAVRLRNRLMLSAGLGVIAAAMAAVSAWFAHPGLPGYLLASSALASMALIGSRVLGHSTAVLLPLAGVGLASAVVSAGVVAGWLPAVATGPLLATGALTVLALSPRWAGRAAGLTPWARAEHVTTNTAKAHRGLTGLVVASAGVSLLGIVLTTVWADDAAASIFTGVMALVLLLRSRIQRCTATVWAVRVAAAGATTVFAAQLAVSTPGTAGWLCAVIITVAVAAVAADPRTLGSSAVVARVLGVLDVLATAAVAPAACAVAEVYQAIGGLL